MKNLKTIVALLLLCIGSISNAQYSADGNFTTTFGNITMTTEYNTEFPNGTLIYGDYRENGTISGYYTDYYREIEGTFFNGSSEGKYMFIIPFKNVTTQQFEALDGFWGYTSVNRKSTNVDEQWNIKSRIGKKSDVKNVTNVWSGTWNTTDGDMHLVQVGNKVTGRYKGLGTVTAIYNPSTRLLKGTFLNQNNNKTGYIEFYFEGNTFKGKWGWNAAMTEGNWDGIKSVKNNKELSKKATTSTSKTNNSNTVNTSDKMVKYRIYLSKIAVPYIPIVITDISNPLLNLYGFAGVRFWRVTSSGRTEIKSFGNKASNFFDKDENHAFIDKREAVILPYVPAYYRDFEFLESDINNPNIDIEVELWHHLKGKLPGKNSDHGKTRQTITLERLLEVQKVKNEIFIGSSCSNGILHSDHQSYAKLTLLKQN